MKRAKTGARATRPRPAPQAEARRSDLLEAAFVLVGERGLEGLRTRDVAARAGVNVSTLHYYFGTKDALLVALIEHVSGKFRAGQAPASAPPPASARTGAGTRASSAASPRTGARTSPPPGDTTVLAHLEAAWRSFQTTPHLTAVVQELALRGHRDSTARSAFRSMHRSWNEVVEDILRAGIEAGRVRADVDVHAAARIMTSFLIGAMTQLGVNSRAFDFGAVARELDRWLAAPAARTRPST